MPECMHDAAYAPAVCLKLPRYAAAPAFFARISGTRTVCGARAAEVGGTR
jgi:hypothetical protein